MAVEGHLRHLDGFLRDLDANTHILLHFTQFQLRRQKVYRHYGPCEHFPSSIWRDEEAPLLEPDSDDTYLCQLCAHKETCQMMSRNYIVLFLTLRH